MYSIVKIGEQWRLSNLDTGQSRRLEVEEAAKIARRYPSMFDPKVRALLVGSLKTIEPKLSFLSSPVQGA